MRVLITGARAPVALDLIRRFHRHGYQVFACDCNRAALGYFSNRVKKSFRVPSPRDSAARFIDALQKITTQHEIELIIPTCEEVFILPRRKINLVARFSSTHSRKSKRFITSGNFLKLLSISLPKCRILG